MQDAFVGDIGDYGKYILLRNVQNSGLSLAINWYRVQSSDNHPQNNGKYINYLDKPKDYRYYDIELFDTLKHIVKEKNRTIEKIEQSGILNAEFYNLPITDDRTSWHVKGAAKLSDADVVFLDPDNGLETDDMHKRGHCTSKYVKWNELSDYYSQGQDVILYQHRPRMKTKTDCIDSIMHYNKVFLKADNVKVLEFPKYNNRFYFMFIHNNSISVFDKICLNTSTNREGFCNQIIIDKGCVTAYG